MKSNRHIVFNTENTSLQQDDVFEGYVLIMGEKEYFLDRYGFSFLRKSIKFLDLVVLLSSKTADVEIINLLNSDSFIIVDVTLAIELKELIAGVDAMLELNTCIHKEIRRKSLYA